MQNIDWRKTLFGIAIFIGLLGLTVWFTRPTDDELEAMAAKKAVTAPQEMFRVTFDKRNWQVSKEVSQDGRYMVQYLPAGDTAQHWKELVTIQVFTGIQDKGSPEEFAAGIEKHIKEWGGEKLVWSVVKKSDNELIYEWSAIGKPDADGQYEVCRIAKGQTAMHLVHYAAKPAAISPDVRAAWLERLEQAKVGPK